MIHELKTWPKYYEEVFMGRKTFEVRFRDRDYNVGDHLNLREWSKETSDYTGRELTRIVTYILEGGSFGISSDHVVMSIQ